MLEVRQGSCVLQDRQSFLRCLASCLCMFAPRTCEAVFRNALPYELVSSCL